MIVNKKIFHIKILYIFFILLSLIIFFFSTEKSYSKAFEINNIEISRPFEINFNKNDVIDEGFKKAFFELISLIVRSSDVKKINQTKLNEIKGMIESFSIKEEKFIDETYYVNLGVSYNRKKVFNYLKKKNIFPSIPIKKKILFVPIIIDENERDLFFFSKNKIFDKWNNLNKSFHLLEYILPSEDLEDLNLIKKNYETIEKYNFEEIISKYSLKDSIIALIFKSEKDIRILSKININSKEILKNQSFSNIDIENDKQIENLIKNLKLIYEDFWKLSNQINTSIRLQLNIKINNVDNKKISDFEKTLNQMDLIYEFIIKKFDKDYTYYEVVFNGTPSIFLATMAEKNFKFDTQNKIWILK